jgi:hypothetical protein
LKPKIFSLYPRDVFETILLFPHKNRRNKNPSDRKLFYNSGNDIPELIGRKFRFNSNVRKFTQGFCEDRRHLINKMEKGKVSYSMKILKMICGSLTTTIRPDDLKRLFSHTLLL